MLSSSAPGGRPPGAPTADSVLEDLKNAIEYLRTDFPLLLRRFNTSQGLNEFNHHAITYLVQWYINTYQHLSAVLHNPPSGSGADDVAAERTAQYLASVLSDVSSDRGNLLSATKAALDPMVRAMGRLGSTSLDGVAAATVAWATGAAQSIGATSRKLTDRFSAISTESGPVRVTASVSQPQTFADQHRATANLVALQNLVAPSGTAFTAVTVPSHEEVYDELARLQPKLSVTLPRSNPANAMVSSVNALLGSVRAEDPQASIAESVRSVTMFTAAVTFVHDVRGKLASVQRPRGPAPQLRATPGNSLLRSIPVVGKAVHDVDLLLLGLQADVDYLLDSGGDEPGGATKAEVEVLVESLTVAHNLLCASADAHLTATIAVAVLRKRLATIQGLIADWAHSEVPLVASGVSNVVLKLAKAVVRAAEQGDDADDDEYETIADYDSDAGPADPPSAAQLLSEDRARLAAVTDYNLSNGLWFEPPFPRPEEPEGLSREGGAALAHAWHRTVESHNLARASELLRDPAPAPAVYADVRAEAPAALAPLSESPEGADPGPDPDLLSEVQALRDRDDLAKATVAACAALNESYVVELGGLERRFNAQAEELDNANDRTSKREAECAVLRDRISQLELTNGRLADLSATRQASQDSAVAALSLKRAESGARESELEDLQRHVAMLAAEGNAARSQLRSCETAVGGLEEELSAAAFRNTELENLVQLLSRDLVDAVLRKLMSMDPEGHDRALGPDEDMKLAAALARAVAAALLEGGSDPSPPPPPPRPRTRRIESGRGRDRSPIRTRREDARGSRASASSAAGPQERAAPGAPSASVSSDPPAAAPSPVPAPATADSETGSALLAPSSPPEGADALAPALGPRQPAAPVPRPRTSVTAKAVPAKEPPRAEEKVEDEDDVALRDDDSVSAESVGSSILDSEDFFEDPYVLGALYPDADDGEDPFASARDRTEGWVALSGASPTRAGLLEWTPAPAALPVPFADRTAPQPAPAALPVPFADRPAPQPAAQPAPAPALDAQPAPRSAPAPALDAPPAPAPLKYASADSSDTGEPEHKTLGVLVRGSGGSYAVRQTTVKTPADRRKRSSSRKGAVAPANLPAEGAAGAESARTQQRRRPRSGPRERSSGPAGAGARKADRAVPSARAPGAGTSPSPSPSPSPSAARAPESLPSGAPGPAPGRLPPGIKRTVLPAAQAAPGPSSLAKGRPSPLADASGDRPRREDPERRKSLRLQNLRTSVQLRSAAARAAEAPADPPAPARPRGRASVVRPSARPEEGGERSRGPSVSLRARTLSSPLEGPEEPRPGAGRAPARRSGPFSDHTYAAGGPGRGAPGPPPHDWLSDP